MFNVLVVEDDKNLRKLIVTCLKKKDYNVLEVENGEKALEVMDTNYVDIIISDIMMPHMDGYELIRELREANFNVPILLITAKSDISDKRTGFLLGADDYMVKPIDIEEMLLRIEVLLRRAQNANKKKIEIGKLFIDYDQRTIIRNGVIYNLALKEFQLLYKFLTKPNVILTRQELIDEIWGLESESDYRTIDVHVKRIREKLFDIDEFEIVTVRGVGYKCIIKEK